MGGRVPRGAIAYAALVGLIGAFVALFTVATLVEAYGPTERDDGRILERHEDEQTVRRPVNPSRPGTTVTTTYPTFTVIGERVDGSSWIVVGEGPYDFAGDHRDDDITVASSTITGRVVALEGDDGTWQMRDAGLWIVGLAGSVFGAALLVVFEAARRRGRVASGLTRRIVAGAGVPAALVGALGAGWVLFGNTWGLEVLTTTDRLDGFAARPFDVEWHVVDSRDVAVVASDNLAGDVLVDHDRAAADAVVVAVVTEPPPARTRHDYLLVSGTDETPAVPCPGGVSPRFEPIGDSGLEGGLVCFPAGTPAETLGVRVTFADLPPRGTWQLPLPDR